MSAAASNIVYDNSPCGVTIPAPIDSGSGWNGVERAPVHRGTRSHRPFPDGGVGAVNLPTGPFEWARRA